MVDYDLALLGWIHAIACLVAMTAFVPVMFAHKGGRRHRASGKVYALAYVVLSVTSLGIYSQQRFWFPHWLALAGLAVLAMGYLAVRVKPKGWHYAHLVTMLLSAYNLFGGGVNEAFLRIMPLREIAGPNILASPVVGMTHGVVMIAFAALIALYVTASLLRRRTIHSSEFRNRTEGRRSSRTSGPFRFAELQFGRSTDAVLFLNSALCTLHSELTSTQSSQAPTATPAR